MASPASPRPALRAVPNEPEPPAWVPKTIQAIRVLPQRGPTQNVVGFHELLGCDVTVESLLDTNPNLESLFARQAKLTGRLDDPSCARVDEFGQEGPAQFVVYRGAFTTYDEIDLPPSFRALSQIATDILTALAHAHGQAIYHGRFDLDSLLFPLEDPSHARVRGFSLHVQGGDTATLVRDDLEAAGRVLWHLAAGHLGEDADPRAVPAGMRLLIARLCGAPVRGRPAPPFASAKEALAELERNFSSTGGMVSTPAQGVTYAGPPKRERRPTPTKAVLNKARAPRGDATTLPGAPASLVRNDRLAAPRVATPATDPVKPETPAPEPAKPARSPAASPSASSSTSNTLAPRATPRAAKRPPYVAFAVVVMAAALAAALGIGLGSAMRDDDPAATPATAVAPQQTDSEAQRDAYETLARVNAERGARELSYAERHRLLEDLRENPEVRDLIDERLQLALDLEQADQASQPCETFRAALRGITADLHPFYRDAVAKAKVPAGDQAPCEGLQAQLEELRAALASQ